MAHMGAGAAIALAASLAGCNSGGGGGADGRLALTGASYCTPFQKAAGGSTSSQAGLAAPASTASDPGVAFDDCIHRWAYAMAPARDPADIVAHATVDACGAAMNAWNQQVMAQSPDTQEAPQPPTRGRGYEQQAQQAQQNPQNSALAQHMQIAEARSLFYVIQARAAGCAPPPANTLVSSPST
jgi:hypothetical protein